MPVPVEKQLPSPMRFFAAINGYQLTAALKAAIELDVFTTIADGAATVPAIATKTKCAERGIRTLRLSDNSDFPQQAEWPILRCAEDRGVP